MISSLIPLELAHGASFDTIFFLAVPPPGLPQSTAFCRLFSFFFFLLSRPHTSHSLYFDLPPVLFLWPPPQVGKKFQSPFFPPSTDSFSLMLFLRPLFTRSDFHRFSSSLFYVWPPLCRFRSSERTVSRRSALQLASYPGLFEAILHRSSSHRFIFFTPPVESNALLICCA